MGNLDEREIARGLQAGRAESWRALYEAFAERVWRCSARLLGANSADVADVVQETFLSAARSAGTFDPEKGSLWNWLWGIGRRQVALHYRTKARHDRLTRLPEVIQSNGRLRNWLTGAADCPLEAAMSAEMTHLVRGALCELPDDYETILTAKYLDDVSIEQLADAQRSTPVAIRSKLARARRAFRELFERFMTPTETEPASGDEKTVPAQQVGEATNQ